MKPSDSICKAFASLQPPSGGCVLKRHLEVKPDIKMDAAAFRRLCVETGIPARPKRPTKAAAFRRLCVET